MKLYYCPWACSLAAHIALFEAGVPFENESVDIRTKVTESGADFNSVTRKGYVPALQLDNGEVVTENIAVLDYLAGVYPQFGVAGPLGRTRLVEALAYISTELHKSFKPYWHNGTDEQKTVASAYIQARMRLLGDTIKGDYLFGDQPTVADFYLFVNTRWAERFGIEIPPAIAAIHDRLNARPAVQATLKAEGLA
ncbi:glutathione S-transferase [Sphingopyxis sp. YR583]|uniref:glutathione binding-like protein n=1 Tax=Sphingopyxis sp. YR583 TaxID=1881047 RepID=UPI0008A7CDA5|nr:glutathione S-transferase C-terminal domain-containing protein [Sphingopyxis sp. YR583]SEH10747.1 glutathione S-transferase [Sphingopyxis sp. YR583]